MCDHDVMIQMIGSEMKRFALLVVAVYSELFLSLDSVKLSSAVYATKPKEAMKSLSGFQKDTVLIIMCFSCPSPHQEGLVLIFQFAAVFFFYFIVFEINEAQQKENLHLCWTVTWKRFYLV